MKLFYPLKSSPLALMVLVSCITWLAHFNFGLFLLQLFMAFIIVHAFAKYLFEVIDHSFAGKSAAPKWHIDLFSNFGQWRHVHLLITLGLLFIPASALLRNQLETLFWLYHAIVMVTLPAYIAVLSAGHGILTPLNPISWIRFIKTAGSGYWLILIVCALTLYIGEHFYRSGLIFIGVFVILYSLVLAFHLLGCLLREHRFELDIISDISEDWEEEKEKILLMKLRGQCLQMVHEQRLLKNTADIIDRHINRHETEHLTAHRWFHEKMMPWEDTTPALLHGKLYIKALMAADKIAAAEMIADELKSLDPAFVVESSPSGE